MLSFILGLLFLSLSWSPSSLKATLSLDINNHPYITLSPSRLWFSLKTPPQALDTSLGPILKSRSALVVDLESGAILFQKNPHFIQPIASLTKIMTAYIFWETEPNWNQEVIMKKEDETEGGKIYVKDQDRLLVKDLFNALLVGSANNAAKALVRVSNLSEEEFVNRMNKKAKEWGLINTHFEDVTGLDPNNTSNVYDLARLAYKVFSYKEIREVSIKPQYQFDLINRKSPHLIKNTNKLILENKLNILASKTGYTEEALYCLLLEVEGEKGHKILVILLGAPDSETRFQEAKNLALWTFKKFKW